MIVHAGGDFVGEVSLKPATVTTAFGPVSVSALLPKS